MPQELVKTLKTTRSIKRGHGTPDVFLFSVPVDSVVECFGDNDEVSRALTALLTGNDIHDALIHEMVIPVHDRSRKYIVYVVIHMVMVFRDISIYGVACIYGTYEYHKNLVIAIRVLPILLLFL